MFIVNLFSKKNLAVFLLALSTILSSCSCPGRYEISNGKIKVIFECTESEHVISPTFRGVDNVQQ